MADYKFEIKEHIGVLAQRPTGWTKELNLISWNDGPAKYDIREWDPEHNKMSKGITLTEDEMSVLLEVMGNSRNLGNHLETLTYQNERQAIEQRENSII